MPSRNTSPGRLRTRVLELQRRGNSNRLWSAFRGHSGGRLEPAWCHLPSQKACRGFPLFLGDFGVVWVVLFPQVKFLQKRMIAFGFRAVEIIQKTAAATDHGKKAATRGKILYGVLEMGGKVIDPFGEKGDLYIG